MSKKIIFILLWIAWLGLLPCTFIYITITGKTELSQWWWLSSVVLALSGWINWLSQRNNPAGSFMLLLATGVSFGAMADIYGNFSAIRFTKPLPMIILLFTFGHFAYIWGTLKLAKFKELTGHTRWHSVFWTTVLLYCLTGIAIWLLIVYPSNILPYMHLPTALYTLLVSLTAAIMTVIAILDRRFVILGLGGNLFLISDVFLAVRLFQNNWYGLGDFCWIIYGISQMLIIYTGIIKKKNFE